MDKKKILGQNFLGVNRFRSGFLSKKQVGLKMYAPSEHSGVKILLGLSYLSERFFLEKNIGRVIPGGGVDDPPPENSRVKIVLGCC